MVSRAAPFPLGVRSLSLLVFPVTLLGCEDVPESLGEPPPVDRIGARLCRAAPEVGVGQDRAVLPPGLYASFLSRGDTAALWIICPPEQEGECTPGLFIVRGGEASFHPQSELLWADPPPSGLFRPTLRIAPDEWVWLELNDEISAKYRVIGFGPGRTEVIDATPVEFNHHYFALFNYGEWPVVLDTPRGAAEIWADGAPLVYLERGEIAVNWGDRTGRVVAVYPEAERFDIVPNNEPLRRLLHLDLSGTRPELRTLHDGPGIYQQWVAEQELGYPRSSLWICLPVEGRSELRNIGADGEPLRSVDLGDLSCERARLRAAQSGDLWLEVLAPTDPSRIERIVYVDDDGLGPSYRVGLEAALTLPPPSAEFPMVVLVGPERGLYRLSTTEPPSRLLPNEEIPDAFFQAFPNGGQLRLTGSNIVLTDLEGDQPRIHRLPSSDWYRHAMARDGRVWSASSSSMFVTEDSGPPVEVGGQAVSRPNFVQTSAGLFLFDDSDTPRTYALSGSELGPPIANYTLWLEPEVESDGAGAWLTFRDPALAEPTYRLLSRWSNTGEASFPTPDLRYFDSMRDPSGELWVRMADFEKRRWEALRPDGSELRSIPFPESWWNSPLFDAREGQETLLWGAKGQNGDGPECYCPLDETADCVARPEEFRPMVGHRGRPTEGETVFGVETSTAGMERHLWWLRF